MNINNHAAIRYLERVISMDMQLHYDCMETLGYARSDVRLYFAKVHDLKFEDLIMPEPVIRAAEMNTGACRRHTIEHDGFRYVLKASTLISVTPAGRRRPRTKHRVWKERFAETE